MRANRTAGARATAAALLIVAALALVACGDDGGDGAAAATSPAPASAGHGGMTSDATPTAPRPHAPEGESPERAVERVLVEHYAGPTCEELTEAAERQFGYGPGPDCDRIIADLNPPRDVTVRDVHVDGDTATGVVDGVTFRLVRRDGIWLIDGVT